MMNDFSSIYAQILFWVGAELFIWGGTADSSRIETTGICRFSLLFFFFFTGLWLTSTAKTRKCNQKRINLTSRWLTLLQNKTFSIFISIKKPSDTRGDGREYAGKRSIPYAVQAYMCMEKKRPLNSPEQFLETVWHWEMLWRLCSLTLILMNAN